MVQDKKTRFGKLTVTYIEDENNIHCTCECGTRIIVAEHQLNDNSSCGCIYRKYLLSLAGVDDDEDNIKRRQVEYPEGRGINFDKKKNKWQARITYQSKEYHLGYFPDKETALVVRKEAETNMNTNFVDWFNIFKNDRAE
jgi:hypothetical protein